jgi:hypothetical protein
MRRLPKFRGRPVRLDSPLTTATGDGAYSRTVKKTGIDHVWGSNAAERTHRVPAISPRSRDTDHVRTPTVEYFVW